MMVQAHIHDLETLPGWGHFAEMGLESVVQSPPRLERRALPLLFYVSCWACVPKFLASRGAKQLSLWPWSWSIHHSSLVIFHALLMHYSVASGVACTGVSKPGRRIVAKHHVTCAYLTLGLVHYALS